MWCCLDNEINHSNRRMNMFQKHETFTVEYKIPREMRGHRWPFVLHSRSVVQSSCAASAHRVTVGEIRHQVWGSFRTRSSGKYPLGLTAEAAHRTAEFGAFLWALKIFDGYLSAVQALGFFLAQLPPRPLGASPLSLWLFMLDSANASFLFHYFQMSEYPSDRRKWSTALLSVTKTK